MQSSVLISWLITIGILILYALVLIGIIVLAVKPYTMTEEYTITHNNELMQCSDSDSNKYKNIPLIYSDEPNIYDKIDDEIDINSPKIIVKSKENRRKLSDEEFNKIYCNSNQHIHNQINTTIDRNLYIAIHHSDGLSINKAMRNINFAIMKRCDIVFISGADPSKEKDDSSINTNDNKYFPRINLSNETNYNHSEIPGYFSYSTTYDSYKNEIYIGASSDSIFMQDPNSKNDIRDMRTNNDGYLISIPIRMASGKFAGKILRLIYIYKKFVKYIDTESFKVVKFLFNYINDNYDYDQEILIIGGYFGIRNELIQLAYEQTKLDKKLVLFPTSNIVTCTDHEGASNPDALLIDIRLITECTNVNVSTYSPWYYINNHNFILLVTLENFKDENSDKLKNIRRSNWSLIHAPEELRYAFPYKYEITPDLSESGIEEMNIRPNYPEVIVKNKDLITTEYNISLMPSTT
jgi:hypothetical protein